MSEEKSVRQKKYHHTSDECSLFLLLLHHTTQGSLNSFIVCVRGIQVCHQAIFFPLKCFSVVAVEAAGKSA